MWVSALNTLLEQKAGKLSFTSGREGATINGLCLSQDLQQMLQVVADLLQNSHMDAITLLAHVGIRRSDALYYPAMVVNQMLGGDTLSSRLGTEIRDKHALSYGVYST